MTIFSGRGLEEELSKVHATLSTTGGSGDWKQRIEVVFDIMPQLCNIRGFPRCPFQHFEFWAGNFLAVQRPEEFFVDNFNSFDNFNNFDNLFF